MLDDECSRRNFLKKFALLSAGSLALSAVTLACYGPGPNQPSLDPEVTDIYFRDAQSSLVTLYGNQNVPVHTTFVIAFSAAMNTVSPCTVSLADAAGNPIAVDKVWDGNTPSSLVITPSADLVPASDYTLTMGSDAVDASGKQLVITSKASAAFKTASS